MDGFRCGEYVQKTLISVVREVLTEVVKNGLSSEHHLGIGYWMIVPPLCLFCVQVFADVDVKSIYIETNPNLEEVISTLDQYGANAVVIDVKTDKSCLTIDLDESSQTNERMKQLLQKFKKKSIYTIARVVTLKEYERLDLCIKNPDGTVRIDKEKMSWMDPNNEKAQAYIEKICTKAIELGFNEVQLDYIRYSHYFREGIKGKDRIHSINKFVQRIADAVHKIGGKISVCVFGCVIEGSSDIDPKRPTTAESSAILGQSYYDIAKIADAVCPMIYPSHYMNGTPKGILDPDLKPALVVLINMQLSDAMLHDLKTKVRPYLQAFTATWLKRHKKYTSKEIQEQIQAVYDAKGKQWGLFNMSRKYPKK